MTETNSKIKEIKKQELQLLISMVEKRALEIAKSVDAEHSIFLTCAFIEKNEANRCFTELGSIDAKPETLELHVSNSKMFNTANKAFVSRRVKDIFSGLVKTDKEEK